MAGSGSISDSSLKAIRRIGEATSKVGKALATLSSGLRINSASDDAAGLSIARALESETRVYGQAARNGGDSISQSNIAGETLRAVGDINGRLQELAAQSANGTLNDQQRATLQAEFSALQDEQRRQVDSAEFNGQKIFSNGSTRAQVGKDSSADSQVTFTPPDANSVVSSGVDISTPENALAALDSLQTQQAATSSAQGEIGAFQSRIETAIHTARISQEQSEAARSSIEDADVAQESATLLAAKILQQSGVAVAAHANLSASNVMRLITGG